MKNDARRLKTTNKRFRPQWLVLGAGLALNTACGSQPDDPAVRRAEQGLSDQQRLVLGFESPEADWTANNGSTLTTSAETTQGSAALSVGLTGYTQVESAQITAPGSTAAEASFDIRVPPSVTWGEARLVVKVPSQGHYWRDLGSQPLASLSPNEFHSLTFSIPADVREALDSTATDVSFVVVLNAPSGLAPFVLDNLRVSEDESDVDAPALESRSVAFAVPAEVAAGEVLIGAEGSLKVDDRVTLGSVGTSSVLSNVGTGMVELGAGVQVNGSVVSTTDITFLRSGAHIAGDVTSSGQLVQQDNVAIDGQVVTGSDVAPAAFSWSIAWPSEGGADVSLPPDSPDEPLNPGSYDSIQVFSRSGIVLTAGDYYVNSLVLEPESRFIADTSGGAIRVYVRDTLRLSTSIDYSDGPSGNLLFGYLGNQTALFQEAIEATVVAPQSAIELRRPNSGAPHRGTFLGQSVHVFSDATVEHQPFDFSFLCESGDLEGDGTGLDAGACGCALGEAPAGCESAACEGDGCEPSEEVSVPEGSIYLGENGDDLGDLPEDRVVIAFKEGPVYLLPELPADTVFDNGGPVGPIENQVEDSKGISGSDDRVPSFNKYPEYISAAQRKVAALSSPCTAAYVGPRHLMTAAHCVYLRGLPDDLDINPFRFPDPIPGQQGEPDFDCSVDDPSYVCTDEVEEMPFGQKQSYAVVVPSAYVNATTESQLQRNDQAMLVLYDSESWGHWFGTRWGGTPPYPPKAIIHRGYPAWSNDCAKSPGDQETCNGFQYWQGSNISDHDDDLIWTWHDTQGGHSGGPYFEANSVLIATHTGAMPDTRAQAVRVKSWLLCPTLYAYRSTDYPDHVCPGWEFLPRPPIVK